MRGGLECQSLGGLVGAWSSCQVLELVPKSLWQSFREELEHKWPKWSTTNAREGFSQIASVFVMTMVCPQWHLRSMKEYLRALVLVRFLFSFYFICLWAVQAVFQVSKLKKLWDTGRFMAVLQMCLSILSSSVPSDPEHIKFLRAYSSLAVTCTTLGNVRRQWVMDFSTFPTQGKWLTILSVITLRFP